MLFIALNSSWRGWQSFNTFNKQKTRTPTIAPFCTEDILVKLYYLNIIKRIVIENFANWLILVLEFNVLFIFCNLYTFSSNILWIKGIVVLNSSTCSRGCYFILSILRTIRYIKKSNFMIHKRKEESLERSRILLLKLSSPGRAIEWSTIYDYYCYFLLFSNITLSYSHKIETNI